MTSPIGASIVVEGWTASTLGTACPGSHDPANKPLHRLWGSPRIVECFEQHPMWPDEHLQRDDPFLTALKTEAIALELLDEAMADGDRAPAETILTLAVAG